MKKQIQKDIKIEQKKTKIIKGKNATCFIFFCYKFKAI